MLRLALCLALAAMSSACDRGPTTLDAGVDGALERDGGPDAGADGPGLDAGPPPLAIPPPEEPMPDNLSELGTVVVEDTPHPQLVEYEPAYPLWTNGSDKRRHVYLPEGTHITGSASFAFPLGTTFIKEFSYGEVHVETRVMRLGPEGWEYFAYRWQGDDATLLDGTVPVDVEVDTPEGTLTHTVPSRRDCRTCHESNADVEVIGFSPTQLAGQLDALGEQGLFAAPPEAPPAIEGSDALETRVLEYVVGNCVHCHNGLSGPSRSFDLRPSAFVANVVGVETTSSASPRGIRVVPGDPSASVLYVALTRGEDFVMPPLGVQRPDASALEMFNAWILSLP